MKMKKTLKKVCGWWRSLDYGNQIIDAWDEANKKRKAELEEQRQIKEDDVNKAYV